MKRFDRAIFDGQIRRFVEAQGRATTKEVAEAFDINPRRALAALRRLEVDGRVVGELCKRYDSQPHRDGWGYSLFGGAGVCVRRFWSWEPAKPAGGAE